MLKMKNKQIMSNWTYDRLVTQYLEQNDPQLMFDPNEGRDY